MFAFLLAYLALVDANSSGDLPYCNIGPTVINSYGSPTRSQSKIMYWVKPAVPSLAYSVRSSDAADAVNDPTYYVSGALTSIHLRVLDLKYQYLGLVMYAIDRAGVQVGSWKVSPGVPFQVPATCGGSAVTHAGADVKPLHGIFFLNISAGTGPISIVSMIKRGEQNTGDFFLPVALNLTERAPPVLASSPRTVYGALGQSCAAACAAAGLVCDAASTRALGATQTSLSTAVTGSLPCRLPLLSGITTVAPATQPDNGYCWYTSVLPTCDAADGSSARICSCVASGAPTPPAQPTRAPTAAPVTPAPPTPTQQPTRAPTAAPITPAPPTPTQIPGQPTRAPTRAPTVAPITPAPPTPTQMPGQPTRAPTRAPITPTQQPATSEPTAMPTPTPAFVFRPQLISKVPVRMWISNQTAWNPAFRASFIATVSAALGLSPDVTVDAVQEDASGSGSGSNSTRASVVLVLKFSAKASSVAVAPAAVAESLVSLVTSNSSLLAALPIDTSSSVTLAVYLCADGSYQPICPTPTSAPSSANAGPAFPMTNIIIIVAGVLLLVAVAGGCYYWRSRTKLVEDQKHMIGGMNGPQAAPLGMTVKATPTAGNTL